MSLHIAVVANDTPFIFPIPAEALSDNELFAHHAEMVREIVRPSIEDEKFGYFVAFGRHRNMMIILGPYERRRTLASAIEQRGFDPDAFAIEFHEPRRG